MIQKDIILRQVQQLAQALAMVLFNKKERRPELAENHITQALRGVFGRDRADLLIMTKDELVEMCSPGNVYSPDLALALADLLREDGEPEARERAGWLYRAALESGELVPLDIHERITNLTQLGE